MRIFVIVEDVIQAVPVRKTWIVLEVLIRIFQIVIKILPVFCFCGPYKEKSADQDHKTKNDTCDGKAETDLGVGRHETVFSGHNCQKNAGTAKDHAAKAAAAGDDGENAYHQTGDGQAVGGLGRVAGIAALGGILLIGMVIGIG